MPLLGTNVLAAYQFDPMHLLFLTGIVLVIAALMIRIRKRIKRNAGQGTPREQLERLRQQSGMRGDLERLMVEIEQLAKRLGAQLDAKTVQLEKTMREAEVLVAKIEAAQRPSETASDSTHTQSPVAKPPSAGGGPDPFTRSVCDLADQGLSAKDIASRLDEHIGKVELVLALRKT